MQLLQQLPQRIPQRKWLNRLNIWMRSFHIWIALKVGSQNLSGVYHRTHRQTKQVS